MLKLNVTEISKRLSEKGYGELIIDDVLEILSSFPIIAEMKSGKIFGNEEFEIMFYNQDHCIPEKGDSLLTSNFEAKIPGLDPYNILSVEIPKLSCRDCNLLILNIEYYPFETSQYKKFGDRIK